MINYLIFYTLTLLREQTHVKCSYNKNNKYNEIIMGLSLSLS